MGSRDVDIRDSAKVREIIVDRLVQIGSYWQRPTPTSMAARAIANWLFL